MLNRVAVGFCVTLSVCGMISHLAAVLTNDRCTSLHLFSATQTQPLAFVIYANKLSVMVINKRSLTQSSASQYAEGCTEQQNSSSSSVKYQFNMLPDIAFLLIFMKQFVLRRRTE